MRIAICFSGQIRTGLDAAENIKQFIGELYPLCDFFVHTWTHNTTPSYINYDPPPEVYTSIEPSVFNSIKELYSPKKMVIEDSYMKDNQDRHTLGFMHRFYTWERSVEYKTEYEIEHGFEYDYVVKLRFDVVYSTRVQLRYLLSRILPGFFGSEHIWVSRGYPTIDDCIWMSDSKTMNLAAKWNKHFYIENHWRDVFDGDPGLHVHFYAYLNLNGIYPYNLLLSENGTWAALRFECVGHDPMVDFEKIREVDRQLFWEDTDFNHLEYEDLISLSKLMREKYNYSSEHIEKSINLIEL